MVSRLHRFPWRLACNLAIAGEIPFPAIFRFSQAVRLHDAEIVPRAPKRRVRNAVLFGLVFEVARLVPSARFHVRLEPFFGAILLGFLVWPLWGWAKLQPF